MPYDNQYPDQSRDDVSKADELPPIEDAFTPEEPPGGVIEDDDPDLLGSATKHPEGVTEFSDEEVTGAPDQTRDNTALAPTVEDDISDAGTVLAEAGDNKGSAELNENPDWGGELSAHRIVVELKRIEAQVRELLEGRDSKRKRKLGGTWRWHDLEEDLIAWKHTTRFDEQTLARLRELITKRHYLFRRLRFLASTRPTWNS